jgi:hypothetical protein
MTAVRGAKKRKSNVYEKNGRKGSDKERRAKKQKKKIRIQSLFKGICNQIK